MSHVSEAAAYIKSQTNHNPTVGIVLGSGLGELAEQIENPCILPYGDIPNFSHSTAPGHKGRLVIGNLAGKVVCCMQGRLHYYEGHTMQDITFPIRVMRMLGIETIILTNSSGGIDPSFQVGDLMMITDHINLLGYNPLIGKNDSSFGPRFNDMTYCYTPEIQEKIRQAAKKTGCDLKEGVYLASTGPSFETPAEIKMFRMIGANAVGMSTVPEAIVACNGGMKIGAISCITNMAAGMNDQPLSEEEVFDTTSKTGGKFRALIKAVVELL